VTRQHQYVPKDRRTKAASTLEKPAQRIAQETPVKLDSWQAPSTNKSNTYYIDSGQSKQRKLSYVPELRRAGRKSRQSRPITQLIGASAHCRRVATLNFQIKGR